MHQLPLWHINSLKGESARCSVIICYLSVGNWPKVLSRGPEKAKATFKLTLGLAIACWRVCRDAWLLGAQCRIWVLSDSDGLSAVEHLVCSRTGSNPWFLPQWQSPSPLLCTAYKAAHLVWRWRWHCRLEHGCGKAGGKWVVQHSGVACSSLCCLMLASVIIERGIRCMMSYVRECWGVGALSLIVPKHDALSSSAQI